MNYQSNLQSQYYLLLTALFCVAVVSIIGAAAMGYIRIPATDILYVIFAKITGNTDYIATIEQNIPFVVMDIRLPRILTAFLVGAALSMSGVIFQGILLNPLADPYTLGVSSGAAFGAAIALFFSLAFMQISVPLFAFFGALTTLLIVMRLSSFGGQISSGTLILSGVIVGAILSAGISFMKYLADEQVSVIIFWLMGSFVSRSWTDVILILFTLIPAICIAIYYSRDLNIIATGNRPSTSLGVDTVRVRKILLLTASLITAVCVSCTGIIGFIGLIIPHLLRLLVGPDNRKLIPLSLLAGGILLLGADTVTRAILPTEIPIGILTALIGGPVFCVIFRKRQKGIRYE